MRCSNSLWQLGLRNLVILKRYVYLFRASTVHPVLTMAIKSTGTPSGKATMQIGKAGVGRRVGWGVKIERKRLVSSWFSNLHNITFPLQNCQLERGRSVYRVLCKHSLLWQSCCHGCAGQQVSPLTLPALCAMPRSPGQGEPSSYSMMSVFLFLIYICFPSSLQMDTHFLQAFFKISDLFVLLNFNNWRPRSSHCGTVETNLNSNHEVAGSIPGLAQWVKHPVLPWAVV